MKVGYGFVVVHFPVARSLKEKRRIVKSILSDMQRKFGVSASEVDNQDQWQVAKIGFAFVGDSFALLNARAEMLFQYLENGWDWEVVDREFRTI
ncbi:MAG: DUF503 domain-containing protein [bacterium JZ-2024 1]